MGFWHAVLGIYGGGAAVAVVSIVHPTQLVFEHEHETTLAFTDDHATGLAFDNAHETTLQFTG